MSVAHQNVLESHALHKAAQLAAVAYVIGEMLLSTVSNVLLRISATSLAPEFTIFIRLAVASVLVMPLLLRNHSARRALMVTVTHRRRFARYLLCGVSAYLASLAWLYAMLKLPLATAMSLFFTTALFMGAMSKWVLAESFGSRNWLALSGGLCGVVLVLQPSFKGAQIEGAVAALTAAVLAACSLTQLKALSGQESPATSALLRLAPIVPLAALPALYVWSIPSPRVFLSIALASLLLALGQAATAKAYNVLKLSQASALEYMRLVFATVAGVIVFSEPVSSTTLIGGAVILAAAFMGNYRRNRTA